MSNIRASCLKTLNFKIDFEKFYKYLAGKYKKLRLVYYYEGIAADDAEKAEKFSDLAKAGYTIKALSRKAYANPAVYKEVKCRKYGNRWRTLV